MELLDYYRDNLRYLRALGAEFAAEFPKIAGRLNLSDFECEDPYIERLLEGTAFLSAQVEKKLDESQFYFLESILNSIAPGALYPIPSGGVLELTPNYGDEKVRTGAIVPRGAAFDAKIPGIPTPCRFTAFCDVPLAPAMISGEQYLTRELGALGIPNNNAVAILLLRLSGGGGNPVSVPGDLSVFLNMSETDASLLQRQIMHDVIGVYIRPKDGDFLEVTGVSFSIPVSASPFHEGLKTNANGLQLLKNYLSYPAFFKFISIHGLRENVRKEFGGEIELAIVFNRRENVLGTGVKAGSLKLNCLPALNIFTKRSDRITAEKEKFEYHIVPDRTAMQDYEVVGINKLEFYNERNEPMFFATNFYDQDIFQSGGARNFFSQHRRKSLFENKSNRRSSYGGTEVFVAFSAHHPNAALIYQFAAELVCTNRDMSLLLSTETVFNTTTCPVQAAFFTASPTRPGYPLVERGDSLDFSKLSHILLNLSSLLWQDGETPLELLRTIIQSYKLRSDDQLEQLARGIVKLETESAVFRFIRKGSVFFETGWKVGFSLDETNYPGTGYYAFGFVLGELLKALTPINTLLEIEFSTAQSGRIATWKTYGD